MTVCIDCGDTFAARGTWQTRCWRCWREQKDNERYTEAWERGYRAGLQAAPAGLDPGLVGDLIQLCHPDRHPVERAGLANRATAALLAVREQTSRRTAA